MVGNNITDCTQSQTGDVNCLCGVPLISATTDIGRDKKGKKLWEMDHQGTAHRTHMEAQAFLNMLGGVERVYHRRVDFVSYRLHF